MVWDGSACIKDTHMPGIKRHELSMSTWKKGGIKATEELPKSCEPREEDK